jgi:hypothetical protein
MSTANKSVRDTFFMAAATLLASPVASYMGVNPEEQAGLAVGIFAVLAFGWRLARGAQWPWMKVA